MESDMATEKQGVTVDQLTRAFIKMRDKRSVLKREFEAQDNEIKEKQEKVKAALLDYCKTNKVDSVRTSEGMFYRTQRKRYWTNDWAAMGKFIMDKGIPEFFEKRLNQGVVADYLEEHPDELPPGLNVDAVYNITVRKK